MSTQAVFDADLNRFATRFEALEAIDTWEDGSTTLNSNAPRALVKAYGQLLQFGYANGLMP